VHCSKLWGLFCCTVDHNAGLFYWRCCCDPVSRELVAEKQTEIAFDEKGSASATNTALENSDAVLIEGEEKYQTRGGASSCGIFAEQTDVHCSKLWGLFCCTVDHNAGLFYWRCCCDPVSRELATEENTEIILEQEESTRVTKFAKDDSDVVQIEGHEVYHPRGASGCGFCAEQTDLHYRVCWGLVSCEVQNNAGVSYCRGCC